MEAAYLVGFTPLSYHSPLAIIDKIASNMDWIIYNCDKLSFLTFDGQ